MNHCVCVGYVGVGALVQWHAEAIGRHVALLKHVLRENHVTRDNDVTGLISKFTFGRR